MLDLLIKNARIVDGSGMPSFFSNVGIRDGKIAVIADRIDEEAASVIDAAGLVLSPGFIDSHSHDDMIMETVPSCAHKLEQGVTTEIVGMCGHSAAPFSEKYFEECVRICKSLCANGVNTDLSTRCSFKTYIEKLRDDFGPSMAFHIGHGTIRTAVMGFDNRKPTAEEMEQMKQMVRDAMEAGALGISFGLIYMPAVFSDTDEMRELCKVAAEYGGDLTIHMRGEGKTLISAVEETLGIVRDTGIRCVISHHKASGGPENWGKCMTTIRMIEEINKEGYSVYLDQYPYVASSTGLSSEVPGDYLGRPKDELKAMIRSEEGMAELKEVLLHGLTGKQRWGRLMFGGSKTHPEVNGVMVCDAAKAAGKNPTELVLEVLADDDFSTSEVSFGMCEEDVEYIMAYPRTMIGTDGLWYPNAGGAHPRAIASFPRYLGHYIRERKVVSLEEGIRKITSMPAAVYGLDGKGLIRVGFDADLCLFDPDTIIDAADFKDWNTRCPGLKYVFVAGQIVVEDSVHNGKLLGKKLLKKL